MGDLTRNFNRSEFACRGSDCCGGAAPVHPRLVTGLQHIRDMLDMPLVITSGFRCITHNRAVGGQPHSYHTLAMAADVEVPPGESPHDLFLAATRTPAFEHGGIIVYPFDGFVHLDIAPREYRAGRVNDNHVPLDSLFELPAFRIPIPFPTGDPAS